MTILSSHPRHLTQHSTAISYGGTCYYAPIRRIAGISGRFGAIDLLINHDRIQRADWSQSVSFGFFTLTLVRKD